MRVARVAPDFLEQLRDLLGQRRNLRLELRDPHVTRGELGILARKLALQFGDSRVAPVRGHEPQSPIRVRMESAKKKMERYESLTRGVNGYDRLRDV